MNIDDADKIRQEAKAAAAAGKSSDDACRWPYDSQEGCYFCAEYIMHKEALAALGLDDKSLTPD